MKIQYPPQFSPLVQDLLKKMFVVKPNDRPGVTELQNHPWLRGLEFLGPNIAPLPVFFPPLKSLASILKLKRRKTIARPEIVQRCVAAGVDEAQLIADLLSGETTPGTTTYFVLCNPVSERPVLPTATPRSGSAPDLAQDGGTPRRQLPALQPVPFREGRRGSVTVVRPVGLLSRTTATKTPSSAGKGRLDLTAVIPPGIPKPRRKL
jgi:serine/threonine protein kinase